MKQKQSGHALVIGGSIAGLVAARVLSERFEQVTVLERDSCPAPGEVRKGVPQGRHAHGLLAQGARILDELFPGLTSTLALAGAPQADLADDVLWHHEGYHCRYPSGMTGIVATRPFLEGHILTRVQHLPNVRLLENTEVTDLVMDSSGRVTGLKVSARDAMGPAQELNADLVVDASGRGSRLPQWLIRAGYDSPQEDRVFVGLTYATRTYRRHPDDANGDIALIVGPSPANRRGAAMIATQQGTWTVTLFGYFGDAPSGHVDEFADFASQLNCPDVHHVIRTAEPLSDVTLYKFAAHRRHRYERLARFPQRLVAIGDAICSFNPIYGQGMTSACLQAEVLRQMLAGDLDGIGPRFFRAAGPVIDGPWSIATGGDLRLPGVVGHHTLTNRFVNWYVGKLHVAARSDPSVALAFLNVANLTDPPQSLMKPALVWRVLRGNLRQRGLAVPVAVQSAPAA